MDRDQRQTDGQGQSGIETDRQLGRDMRRDRDSRAETDRWTGTVG